MLVLLMEEFYELRHCNGLRRHDTHTKFLGYLFRHLGNITVIIATVLDAVLW
jgi:hypothetical protein